MTAHGELASRMRLALARLYRELKLVNPGALALGEWSALAAIERAGSIRNSDLAGVERVSAPTMTRIVANLESQGLVTRRGDPADRRSSFIALSPVGAARLEWARGLAANALAEWLTTMPAELIAQLEATLPVLERLADSAESYSESAFFAVP
jgi:DNA-binding MarR family transcriptional regulator